MGILYLYVAWNDCLGNVNQESTRKIRHFIDSKFTKRQLWCEFFRLFQQKNIIKQKSSSSFSNRKTTVNKFDALDISRIIFWIDWKCYVLTNIQIICPRIFSRKNTRKKYFQQYWKVKLTFYIEGMHACIRLVVLIIFKNNC